MKTIEVTSLADIIGLSDTKVSKIIIHTAEGTEYIFDKDKEPDTLGTLFTAVESHDKGDHTENSLMVFGGIKQKQMNIVAANVIATKIGSTLNAIEKEFADDLGRFLEQEGEDASEGLVLEVWKTERIKLVVNELTDLLKDFTHTLKGHYPNDDITMDVIMEGLAERYHNVQAKKAAKAVKEEDFEELEKLEI